MINEEIKSGEQFSFARTLIFNAATKVGIKIPTPTFFIQKFHNQYFFFQTGICLYSFSARFQNTLNDPFRHGLHGIHGCMLLRKSNFIFRISQYALLHHWLYISL